MFLQEDTKEVSYKEKVVMSEEEFLKKLESIQYFVAQIKERQPGNEFKSETEFKQLLTEVEEQAKFFTYSAKTFQSNYDLKDFINEFSLSLCHITTKYENYKTRFCEVNKTENLSLSSNEFWNWFVTKAMPGSFDLVNLVCLCRVLFYERHMVSFSFISTQILRLFNYPTLDSFKFIRSLNQFNFLENFVKLNVEEQKRKAKQIAELFKDPQNDVKCQKCYHEIISIVKKFLKEKAILKSLNSISNAFEAIHLEFDTSERINDFSQNLGFTFQPAVCDSYGSMDYQKRIYLNPDYFPENDKQYAKKLMSIITLIHEIGHFLRMDSAPENNPLILTPQKLEYEAGEFLEKQIFSIVVVIDDLTEEEAKTVLEDGNDPYLSSRLKSLFEVKRKKNPLFGNRKGYRIVKD